MWTEIIAINVLLLHLCVCPFTKVEESFNMQAIHDVMNHGFNVEKYDHLEFPGVVPRTFLGPLVIGILSKPLTMISESLGHDKFAQQYIVRGVIGLATMLSFFVFCKGVEFRLGSTVKRFLILVTITQFHFMFYASRPLPNIFALNFVLLALSSWLHQKHTTFIWLAGASIVIFRFDLAMFFGIILLFELLNGRMTIEHSLLTTISAGIAMSGLTVLVDSYFWQRWLWPEGEVMWFNVVLNRSKEYGTLPFLWYLYSALPRAMLSTLVLVPAGVYFNRHVMTLLWPAIGYIILFSFLPHKELRFIIYTFPLFNTAAACALASLWKNKDKSFFRSLLLLGSLGLLVLNMAGSMVFLVVSHHNYPGGAAMQALHKVETNTNVHVHIDAFNAQTGVTRFTQLEENWIYKKTEKLARGGPDMLAYSHLLIGASGPDDDAVRAYAATHKTLVAISAFESIGLDLRSFPPLKINLKQKSFVLKRKV